MLKLHLTFIKLTFEINILSLLFLKIKPMGNTQLRHNGLYAIYEKSIQSMKNIEFLYFSDFVLYKPLTFLGTIHYGIYSQKSFL